MLGDHPIPLVSAILTFDAQTFPENSIESLLMQIFPDWELLIVNNRFFADPSDRLKDWAAKDPRIHVLQTTENTGINGARNFGLMNARGQWIAYLNGNEEFYPDYLAHIVQHRDKGDVLVFCTGHIHRGKNGEVQERTWAPGREQQNMFLRSVSPPLGVAHRRALIEKAGLFNELLWCDAEGDYWRRLARAGASFVFLPLKSGECHLQTEDLDSRPVPNASQREILVNNWRQGKPLYGNQPIKTPPRKIAFISAHCSIDFTSGAAIATLRLLRYLNLLGYQCEVFCSSRLDAPEELLLEQTLAEQGCQYEVRHAHIGPYTGRMIFAMQGSVPVTIYETASTRGRWQGRDEIAAFFTALDIFLDRNKPDAVMLFGGDPISREIINRIKRRDIPLIFALRNFSYPVVDFFQSMDYVFVPSEFSRQYHWEKLGLACHVLPNVMELEKICALDRKPEYLTFVNPDKNKGVYVLARIALELARHRPDIPLLIVEGRERSGIMDSMGGDIKGLTNIRIMPNTPDPRRFYGITKAMLVPSIWNESFGLVAAEAMCNGIPVLASNRGSLPEIVGQGGLLFDIPAKYTPKTCEIPSPDEVAPWLEVIIRLWDDGEYYQKLSRLALEESHRWYPERLAETYKRFFNSITHQPGPPFVPKDGEMTSFSTASGFSA
jgi:glycosyltransferase involved in cell wall biosynthesis